jgi:hypothetical protein
LEGFHHLFPCDLAAVSKQNSKFFLGMARETDWFYVQGPPAWIGVDAVEWLLDRIPPLHSFLAIMIFPPAAFFVFFPAAAGAGVVAGDFGIGSRDGA